MHPQLSRTLTCSQLLGSLKRMRKPTNDAKSIEHLLSRPHEMFDRLLSLSSHRSGTRVNHSLLWGCESVVQRMVLNP